MKNFKLLLLSIISSLIITTGCSETKHYKVDLDRVLKIMSATLTSIDNSSTAHKDNGNDTEVMKLFATKFHTNINNALPNLHPDKIGIKIADNGSVIGFNDKNNNNIQDSGERKLFKVEIDGKNNRLLASEDQYYRQRGFSGGGLFTGLWIGSMLSRQRSSGVRASSIQNRQASPKQNRASRSSSPKSRSTSAKSRSRSGSFSRGK